MTFTLVAMAAKLPKTTQVAPSSTSAQPTLSKALVLAGPSGAGKSTLIKKLFADNKDVFGFSVSRKDEKIGGGGREVGREGRGGREGGEGGEK